LRFVWDNNKSAANKAKHGIDFETAKIVFDDSLALSRRDIYPYEERWQTIGNISYATILVIHAIIEKDADNEEIIRIISARKATAAERRAYEEGDF